jgi:hypothetical protein
VVAEEKIGRGKHPNSRANLKPIQPGQVLNPSGRPRQVATKLLRDLATTQIEGAEEGDTYAKRIALKVLQMASDGNTEAIKIYHDRMEGRPRQSISLDTDEHTRLERRLENYLSESERAGDPLSRSDAIAILAEEDPRFEGFE